MTEICPKAIHAFDQAYATFAEQLDSVLSTVREEYADPEGSRMVTIGELTQWLIEHGTVPSLASILAVAIDRLADR